VVSNTSVKDLRPLAQIHTLENLTAWNTRITGLRPLARLPKLAHLVLGGTDVRDLRPLRNVKTLVALNLERTAVSDLSPLRRLSRLRFLNLTRTHVTTSELKALRTSNPALRVTGCAGTGDQPCLKPLPAKMPQSCKRLLACCARSTTARAACGAFKSTVMRLRKLGSSAERQLDLLCRGQRARWRRKAVKGPVCPEP